MVRDLGSMNGTFVRGQRLPKNGSIVLRPGDEIRCGFQVFRLTWTDLVPSPPLPKAKIPSAPVSIGQPVAKPPTPPVLRIPPQPSPSFTNSRVKPSLARWIKQGEVVELGGRRIDVGLFFFGTNMKDALGYGPEPSLIDPLLSISQESETGIERYTYRHSYSEFGPNLRAGYIDWLAAGRPPSEMSDPFGFLFLSGIERRHLVGPELVQEGFDDAVLEIRRLIAGAPENSRAIASMRQFLLATGGEKLPSADEPLAKNILCGVDDHQALRSLQHVTACRIATGVSMNYVEALIATAVDEGTYLRTPFFRCPLEVAELFRLRYLKRYPQGVRPKILPQLRDNTYRAVNFNLYGWRSKALAVHDYRIAPSTLNKLREFLTQATEEVDDYSRRLYGHNQEAGRLPAVALLPADLAVQHPEIRRLAELARVSTQNGGRLQLSEIANIWTDWPVDRNLNRHERELLNRALWQAGFLMEPNPSTPCSLATGNFVLVSPCDKASLEDPSPDYYGAVRFASLVASILAHGRKLDDKDRSWIKTRLAAFVGLQESEILRLGLYFDWISEMGVPKAGKRALDALPVERRSPTLHALAELAAATGNVVPAVVKEIVRVAKVFGITEEEAYAMIHETQASLSFTTKQSGRSKRTETDLDMELVASKLASSQVASEILGSVFLDDEEPVTSSPITSQITATEDQTRQIVRALTDRTEWPFAQFADLAGSFGKLPSAIYDDLNEAALDLVGDLLLEGDDPIRINSPVAQELLR